MCDFHIFMDIFLFYSLLEGFRTSFQDYHKTSYVILHLEEFSIMLNLFSNLFLKTPSIKGWLDGRPCLVNLIENLFKQVHDKVEGMSYTLYPHCVFNWHHN